MRKTLIGGIFLLLSIQASIAAAGGELATAPNGQINREDRNRKIIDWFNRFGAKGGIQ